jgi:hypothetical protein
MALLRYAKQPPFRNGPSACFRGLAMVSALLGFAACLSGQTATEYEVKAAFLYKFASFVAFPTQGSTAPICIGVIGEDPFGETLDAVVKDKTVNGRSFVIRRFNAGQDVEGCQILFISASEKRRLRGILDGLQAAPLLTVGDMPGFCESGGMVKFDLADDHVRLDINVKAAERARLQVSSKLLSLARLVPDVGQKAIR